MGREGTSGHVGGGRTTPVEDALEATSTAARPEGMR